MNININITKKHLYILFSVIALLGIAIFVRAATLNTAQPWHILQQVSTSSTSGLSVDENNNGLIDAADSSDISDNTLRIQGKPVYWDTTTPNKLCYDFSTSCSTTTLTCNVLSTSFNTGRDDYSPDGCDNDCRAQCIITPACQGDPACSASTKVYFTNGQGQPLPNKQNVCACTCSRSAPATYITGTSGGSTRNCVTFNPDN